jgi:signal transduction histidine kinase
MATESGRPTRSLRQRLIVGITVTAALAAFSEAMLLHLVWSRYEYRLIERVVRDELRRSLQIHEREPQLAYPNTDDLTLYVSSDDPSVPDDPVPEHLRAMRALRGAPGGEIAIREVRGSDGVDYHVGVARRGMQTYLLVYDARGHAERSAMLLWAVLAIAAALTLMAASLARGSVDRLLAGLSRLQRRVADGTDARGYVEPGMDVEVAALADALDDQRRQVAAALRKERAFAAAASHELRTPLTRIATGAEVLLAQPALADPVAARVRSIRESADELQRLLEVLLQVARWQPGERGGTPPPEREPARPLGEVVDACVRRLAAEARLLGTTVSVSVAEPQRTVAHPAMLEVVLSNLLRNAIRHGRSAPVSVVARDGVLEVADAGPGIEAAAIDRVFDPFWRGAPGGDETGPSGLGLGLSIAERICAVAGWSLAIASGTGQGTRATVRLGPQGEL